MEQLFGKVGWQDEVTDVDLSLTTANNHLDGTQTIPASFMDDFRQAYTFPDSNRNRATLLSLKASHFLEKDVLLGGNAYVRRYQSINVSSDVNDDFGSVDDDTGEVDDAQATNDRSEIQQTSYGLGLQLTVTKPLWGHDNRWVVGASGSAQVSSMAVGARMPSLKLA